MTHKRYTEIPKRQKCVNKEEPYIGGARDIFDDKLEKPQEQVNEEILNEIGADDTPDSIKGRVKNLETEVGSDDTPESIKGRIKTIEDEIGDDTTEESLSGRIKDLEEAVGDGGSVDERITAAKDEIKGNASSACDTLGEAEALINNRYTKSETYNKTELNSMITTPNQEYVTVTATDQTTDVTDVLPATGSADTVYRVGNWDGTQFDETVYSEYAWNGSAYVHLGTKTQIGEVFDISAYHATGGELAKYADLTAALDSNNGGGVPQSLQKGGISVKFVLSSDNKYVQYRLTAENFSISVFDWQSVDDIENDLNHRKPLDLPVVKAGKYYAVSGTSVTLTDNSASKYCEAIDVSEYEGCSVEIVLYNYQTTGSSRSMVITDENGVVINYSMEAHPTSTNAYSATFVLPIKGTQLLISFISDHTLASITIVEYKKVGIDIDNINKSLDYIKETDGKDLFSSVIAPEFLNGYIDYSSGNFVYNETLRISDYIPVKTGETVSCIVGAVSSRYSFIGYDEDKNIIASFSERGTERNETYTKIIPSDVKYIRVAHDSRSSNDWNIKIFGKIDSLQNQINKAFSTVITPKWIDGYINASTGKIVEDSSSLQVVSEMIPVIHGMFIKTVAAVTSARLMVGMYEQNVGDADLTKSIVGTGSTEAVGFVVPDGINFIRVSHDSRTTNDWNVYIRGDVDTVIHSIPVADSINNQWLRLHKSAPKKPVIAFEMDMNAYSEGNAIEYINILNSYGVKGSTFFVFPNQNYTVTASFQNILREIYAKGHEIALHSLPTDGTGETTSAPQATEQEFRAFMKTYFDWFGKYGYYPTGWVTTQGKLYDGLLPLVKEYMNYAHTLPNGNWQDEPATDYVIPRSGDRYTFTRYGYEMGENGTAEQEAVLIAKIKAGIDKAIAENKMLILYCHSYNNYGSGYTLRPSVLTAVLNYIKPYIDNYRLVTGNVQDLVEYFFD